MSDIRIQRDHALGYARACELARTWVDQAERELGLACQVQPGEGDEQVVQFSRSGVSGTLRVTGERFELDAKLGFLLAGFRNKIQAQIDDNLDRLLQGDPPAQG